MLILNDTASVSRALADTTLCPDPRALLGLRAWTLCVEQGGHLGTDVRLAAILGGDTAEAIEAALGFPLNEMTAYDPALLRIDDHGLWYEVVFSRDGEPYSCVFVENGPATELGVHYLGLTASDQDEVVW
jgi:hypothetical protein